jgi:hypothetical protein
VIVSFGYLPTSAGSWSGAILSDTWDAICRPETYLEEREKEERIIRLPSPTGKEIMVIRNR